MRGNESVDRFGRYRFLGLYWEPIDSVQDVMPAVLSASTFLCFIRGEDREPDA